MKFEIQQVLFSMGWDVLLPLCRTSLCRHLRQKNDVSGFYSSKDLTVGCVGFLLQNPQFLVGIGHPWQSNLNLPSASNQPTNQGPGLLDDDEPAPFTHRLVLAEVPLSDLYQLPDMKALRVLTIGAEDRGSR